MRKLLLTCLFTAAALLPGRAAIICVAPTSTASGSLQITSPISFNVTATTNIDFLVLSNWVTNDGSNNFSIYNPAMNYVSNGTAGSAAGDLHDNTSTTAGSLKPNDGYILFDTVPPGTNGTVFTLLAGTYSLNPTANFNPQATQTFTGSLFLADNTGTRISNIVSAGAVPEPSTWALLGLGGAGLGLMLRRRRQQLA